MAFSLLVGIGGVLLAVNREEGFTARDAVLPASLGITIGLLIAAVVLWFYYAKRWRPDARTQFLSVPLLAGLGGTVAYGPPAFLVGVAMACCGIVLPLMVWGGIVSRRAGTSWPQEQEPDS